jgi:hypothetical protein
MLSWRFIGSFFVFAIVLAWVLPTSWMHDTHILRTEPSSPWKEITHVSDVVWNTQASFIKIIIDAPERPLLVSGWSIENEQGERVEIGPSVDTIPANGIAEPAPLSISGTTTLVVSFSSSPLGVSFRVHPCSHYLRGTQDFIPPLERMCPSPSTDPRWEYLDGSCRLTVETLPRCEVYSPEYLTGITPACGTFMKNTLNYASCLSSVGKTSPLSEWRIFVGEHPDFVNEQGGILFLKDEQGLLMSRVQYGPQR